MLPSLWYSLLMSRDPLFYFSITTLIVGTLGSLYLLYEWLKHKRRHKFYVFWSVGLFILYLFQIPFILVNSGFHLTVTDFNAFYSVAFPLTFLGLILIYLGIRSVSPPRNPKRLKLYLFFWFVLSLLVFSFYFIVRSGYVEDYTIQFLVIFLFFIPTYFLNLFALSRWFKRKDLHKTKLASFGIIIMMLGIFSGLLQAIIAIPKILAYPPQFWFLALTEFKLLFFLQSLGVLLLLFGFLLVHRNCRGILNGKE